MTVWADSLKVPGNGKVYWYCHNFIEESVTAGKITATMEEWHEVQVSFRNNILWLWICDAYHQNVMMLSLMARSGKSHKCPCDSIPDRRNIRIRDSDSNEWLCKSWSSDSGSYEHVFSCSYHTKMIISLQFQKPFIEMRQCLTTCSVRPIRYKKYTDRYTYYNYIFQCQPLIHWLFLVIARHDDCVSSLLVSRMMATTPYAVTVANIIIGIGLGRIDSLYTLARIYFRFNIFKIYPVYIYWWIGLRSPNRLASQRHQLLDFLNCEYAVTL